MAKIISFPVRQAATPVFASGVVVSEQKAGYEVLMSQKLVTASVCASCFLKPAVGDEVILIVLRDKVFIFAITETNASTHNIDFGAEVAIEAHNLLITSDSFAISTHHHRLKADSSIEQFSQSKNTTAPLIREQAERVTIQADHIALN